VGILTCIDATKTGDVTAIAKIWEYRGIHRSISTVSLDPETGLIFVGDFSGFVHCLDAETGKVHWTHDMKAHMWGSTFLADGKVYVGDEDGDFVVLAAAKEKKIISETNLGAAVYGTPIVANGAIYIQSNTHLFAFRDPTKQSGLRDEPQKIEIKLEK
jgi:outer membrane protein assembly factor BamB